MLLVENTILQIHTKVAISLFFSCWLASSWNINPSLWALEGVKDLQQLFANVRVLNPKAWLKSKWRSLTLKLFGFFYTQGSLRYFALLGSHMIVSDLPRSHTGNLLGKRTCISAFNFQESFQIKGCTGGDSQSTHELWGPQGSTCASLQWCKRCEPMLSLHFFQGEAKKPCLLYLVVCFHGTSRI